jgi:coenzyme F420 hydrogenase subunit beta
MRTFSDLIEEVQKPGLCVRCGGCVTFCTAINYGALELDQEGKPRYKDASKCVEGGLCYAICPETHELDEEVKRSTSWKAPMGAVLDTTVARAKDPDIRSKGTDGGVVTALLVHLLDKGLIDGAIVTRKTGVHQREPWLATTREEIMDAAGFHFETSHGLELFSELYATYSAFAVEIERIGVKQMDRVAFVGTPCQVNTIRRIQAMGVAPANAIKVVLGLFCTGNFVFGPKQKERIAKIGGFQWEDVVKINVKEQLMVHLQNGEFRCISLDRLDFMKRYACHFCPDYTSEFADLSFGGLGAPEGWTTVISRSTTGRNLLSEALTGAVESFPRKENPHLGTEALEKAMAWSNKKKNFAKKNRARDVENPETVKP